MHATRPGEAGEEPVRLGFVGLGDRGRQLLAAAVAHPRTRVSVLCDPDTQRLRKTQEHLSRRLNGRNERGARIVSDARHVFEADDVDAVIIATPVFLHASHTIAAFDAGKHVYCEKPLARTFEECANVLDACTRAESRGLIYQSGLQRRYNPRYRASLDHLHSGAAGAIRFVRAQWHAMTPARKDKPWLHRREKSGDIVLEQACHQFDIFNWVFGEVPTRVVASGSNGWAGDTPGRDVLGRDVLDDYSATLEYPSGGRVQLSHLTYSIPDRRFSGIYELAFCERSGVDLPNALTWDSSGKSRELCQIRGNETQLAVASFIDDLIGGRRPAAGARAAYEASVAALMCRQAIETGESVSRGDFIA